MRKYLLISFLSIVFPFVSLKAQTPEKIYIGTWETMSELGSPVNPNEEDPVLQYNEATGCYEGEIIDWAKCLGTSAWNAKIPYCVNGEEIIYFSNTTSTNITFTNSDEFASTFITDSNPSGLKGYIISTSYSENVVDVKVSMNLETREIIFTKFQSDEGKELPVLLSIVPENGSEITPDENGGVTVTITFSGQITRLEVATEASGVEVESSEDGMVWNIYVPASVIEAATKESQGLLNLKIENVYAGNLPVALDQKGNNFLYLSYMVEGITNSAVILFDGDEKGLATLDVYKSPNYNLDDALEIESSSFDFTFSGSVTYLFTVGSDYEVNIASTIESGDGTNWSLGEAYSQRVTENTGTSYKTEDAVLGTTLTIKRGANGAVFTVTVVDKNAGVPDLLIKEKNFKVFDLNGVNVLNTDNSDSFKNLKSGIYIINGKKIIIN